MLVKYWLNLIEVVVQAELDCVKKMEMGVEIVQHASM